MKLAIFKKTKHSIPLILIFFAGVPSGAGPASDAAEWTCRPTRVERMGDESSTQKAIVCISKNKNQMQSKTCLDGKCLRHVPRTPVSKEGLWGPIGNPGFHLCHRLGYVAEMVRMQEGGGYREFGRCLFTATDFVDTDLLFKMVRWSSQPATSN